MATFVEFDNPLPGDTAATTIPVDISYGTDLAVVAADRIDCKLIDRTNTQVGATQTKNNLPGQNGSVTFSFAGVVADSDYKLVAQIFIAASATNPADEDTVDEINVAAAGGGALIMTVGPII